MTYIVYLGQRGNPFCFQHDSHRVDLCEYTDNDGNAGPCPIFIFRASALLLWQLAAIAAECYNALLKGQCPDLAANAAEHLNAF